MRNQIKTTHLFSTLFLFFINSAACATGQTYSLGEKRESVDSHTVNINRTQAFGPQGDYGGFSVAVNTLNEVARFKIEFSQGDPKYSNVTTKYIETPSELGILTSKTNFADYDIWTQKTEYIIMPSLSALLAEIPFQPKFFEEKYWREIFAGSFSLRVGGGFGIHLFLENTTYNIRILDSDKKGERVDIPFTGSKWKPNVSFSIETALKIWILHLGMNAITGIEMPSHSRILLEFGVVW